MKFYLRSNTAPSGKLGLVGLWRQNEKSAVTGCGVLWRENNPQMCRFWMQQRQRRREGNFFALDTILLRQKNTNSNYFFRILHWYLVCSVDHWIVSFGSPALSSVMSYQCMTKFPLICWLEFWYVHLKTVRITSMEFSPDSSMVAVAGWEGSWHSYRKVLVTISS